MLCEVCEISEIHPVLNLGKHALCDDLIKIGEDRINKKYPIEIAMCPTCYTAHQIYQVAKTELFPASYHYRSRFTQDVLNGMQDLVNSIEQEVSSLDDKKVLDIGCNDGSLLNFFSERGAITIGVEPTDAAADAKQKCNTVYQLYFDSQTSEKIKEEFGCVDIITFTNVFAHIEDLQGLLRALKTIMHEDTLLVIENHYLGAVFEKNQFDTFYHEHPRTYSAKAFEFIANKLNRKILLTKFPKRYGGNIRVYIGNKNFEITEKAQLDLDHLKTVEKSFPKAFGLMNDFIVKWKTEKLSEIELAVEKHGKLPAKAFPGRAAILVELLGLSETQIEAVYEKPGSLKIGHYVPGTKIPIKSDEDITYSEQGVILNLAWHIHDEIENYLHSKQFVGKLISVL